MNKNIHIESDDVLYLAVVQHTGINDIFHYVLNKCQEVKEENIMAILHPMAPALDNSTQSFLSN